MMVNGMITIAIQEDAVARAVSVRASSTATRGSGRGATATRAVATALESALARLPRPDRKSTRLNSSHVEISYAVFCLKKKKKKQGTFYCAEKNISMTEKLI